MTDINRDVDVYEFKDNNSKMNKSLCEKLRDRTFGPPDEISLKIKSTELFPSPRSGLVCQSVLVDPGTVPLFKERHFVTFVINFKTYGLVFRSKEAMTLQQVESVRKFVKGLRAKKIALLQKLAANAEERNVHTNPRCQQQNENMNKGPCNGSMMKNSPNCRYGMGQEEINRQYNEVLRATVLEENKFH